jgi:hypothetical protein
MSMAESLVQIINLRLSNKIKSINYQLDIHNKIYNTKNVSFLSVFFDQLYFFILDP